MQKSHFPLYEAATHNIHLIKVMEDQDLKQQGEKRKASQEIEVSSSSESDSSDSDMDLTQEDIEHASQEEVTFVVTDAEYAHIYRYLLDRSYQLIGRGEVADDRGGEASGQSPPVSPLPQTVYVFTDGVSQEGGALPELRHERIRNAEESEGCRFCSS